jgi:flagellar motility protein MotE (MotC chaperone)
MIRLFRFKRDVRLIPLVLFATASLFALKVSGLVFDGGYTLGERLAGADKSELTPTTRDSIPKVTPIIIQGQELERSQPWAREMFNYGGDVTGSVGASKPAEPAKDNGAKDKNAKTPIDPPNSTSGRIVALEPVAPPGERAILERLSDRRQQLDEHNRDLEMRESLLKAAEKRVEARVAELKELETKVKSTLDQRDQDELKRFKGVVTMYENMKPKDAARIFDRLDIKILVDVSTQMKPATMSAILAQMSPDAAERLTVELANHAGARKGLDSLPQIEGKPGVQ